MGEVRGTVAEKDQLHLIFKFLVFEILNSVILYIIFPRFLSSSFFSFSAVVCIEKQWLESGEKNNSDMKSRRGQASASYCPYVWVSMYTMDCNKENMLYCNKHNTTYKICYNNII